MSKEYSPYEQGGFPDLAGQTALGKIISVDKNTRTCRVKTLGKKGITDDQDLWNVQWIQLSSSVDGSQDTVIPEINTYGVVIFINNEPYIFGYYTPINSEGDDQKPNQEDLGPGSKVFKTSAGNKVIIHSGGSVEVQSTDICRTYWLPSRNLITSICMEYEIEASGGYRYWHRDSKTDDTTLKEVVFDNTDPTVAVQTEQGANVDGSTFSQKIGALDDQNEVDDTTATYKKTISDKGELFESIKKIIVNQVGAEGSQFTTVVDSVGKTASFLTPSGSGIIFDDAKKTITLRHETGAAIQMTATGEVIIQMANGSIVNYTAEQSSMTSVSGATISVKDDITVVGKSGKESLLIKDGLVQILSGEDIILQGNSFNVKSGSVILGGDSFHAVLYETLQTIFDGHFHASAVGPTGPPLPPFTMAITAENTLLSAKAKYIKLKGNLPI